MTNYDEVPFTDVKEPEMDYSQLTVYDVLRLKNCKSNRFLHRETYPCIRPPVSKCCNAQTGEWLAEAAMDIGCKHPFAKNKYDIVEIWNRSPNKDTLSCYGLGKDKERQEEADHFNRSLTKSLNTANGVKPKSKQRKTERQPKVPKPRGAYVLNRNWLQNTIRKMPTVIGKTRHKTANTICYCPDLEDPDNAFEEDEPYFPLQVALDMVKPKPKPKHGLRRHHKYCSHQCGIPENACTQYEWMKYKEDPLPYDVALQMEMHEITEEPKEIEPKNFDHLYARLNSCFEQKEYEIPECMVYAKQCKPSAHRGDIQGCGEHNKYRPFGKLWYRN